MSWRRTTWEIRAIPEADDQSMRVRLTLDTADDDIVESVERAAAAHGITLHRVETDRDE